MGNLKVFFSNRIENLLASLAETVRQPASDDAIFSPETILLDNKVLGQWLDIQFAQKNGISANIEFIQPSQFFWFLAKHLVSAEIPAESPFAKEVMAWRLFNLLADETLLADAVMLPVKKYLEGQGKHGLKRFQLANSIADLFDQYLIYRPEWINQWSEGRAVNWDGKNSASTLEEINGIENWQRLLWKKLLENTDQPELHRAAVLHKLQEKLQAESLAEIQSMGMSRLCVFGISSLPPSVIGLLLSLGKHIPVYLYVLNPCQEFWFDIKSARDWVKIHMKLEGGNKKVLEQETLDIGNPLLAGNGQQVKEFINSLVSLEGEAFQIDDQLFENPGDTTESPGDITLLRSIQQEILDMTYCGDEPASYAPGNIPDRSVRPLLPPSETYAPLSEGVNLPSVHMHICYSRMREVEVLHDQLLHLFKYDKKLKPRDVVVMMPDVAAYVPYIETVFGNTREKLPYHITDRSRVDESPLLHSLELLLNLPASRMHLSEVIAILEVPAVQAKFNLSYDDFETLKGWLIASGARWGLDKAHREDYGLPPYNEFTWDFAIQRLWTGYAMSSSSSTLDKNLVDVESITLLPFDEIGEASAIFESFIRFWEKLLHYRKNLAVEQTSREWSLLLNALLGDFYGTVNNEKNNKDARLDIDEQIINEVKQNINDLAEVHAYYSGNIDLDVIKAWLKPVINASSSGLHHWREGIKFCSLLPMRAVPFRVVYLMGMNMNDYPKRAVKPSFDLMRFQHKPGDRSRRVDDRWLFLEALLSARDYFYISYVGRDLRTNQKCEPSVVVSELLDYLRYGYKAKAEPDETNEEQIVDILCTEHPLQPFSERYFDHETPGLFSYNNTACSVAGSTVISQSDTAWQKIKGDAEKEDVETSLNDFVLFFKDPARWLFTKRYKTSLTLEDNVVNDEETFSPEKGMEEWSLRDDLYTRLQYTGAVDEEQLANTIDRMVQEKKAGAEWPVGYADAVAHNALLANISPDWINAWHEMADGCMPETRIIEKSISTPNGNLLIGGSVQCVNHRFLFHTASKRSAKHELDFTVRACLASSTFNDIQQAAAVYYADAGVDIEELNLARENSAALLQVLAELYMAYRDHGLPFEPKLGKALFDNSQKSEPKDIQEVIHHAWYPGPYSYGALQDDIQQRAYYLNAQRLGHVVFTGVCESVWEAVDQWKAAAQEATDQGGQSS